MFLSAPFFLGTSRFSVLNTPKFSLYSAWNWIYFGQILALMYAGVASNVAVMESWKYRSRCKSELSGAAQSIEKDSAPCKSKTEWQQPFLKDFKHIEMAGTVTGVRFNFVHSPYK